jgi:quercetin dioxygenase-like cupin family protein
MEVCQVKRLTAIRSPLLALALVAVFAGAVLATDPSGFGSVLQSRGPLGDSVHFNTGAVKFQTKGSVDVAAAVVTIAPGGVSGWHEHPGIVLLTVKSGTVTFYDQTCVGIAHPTGTSFVEANGDGPGLARNESASVDAVVNVTYIVPTGAALRINTPVAPCVLP